MTTDTIPIEEIIILTGVRQPAAQVRRLKKYGFTRARCERGRTVLERPHYEAVSAGRIDRKENRPKVKRVE